MKKRKNKDNNSPKFSDWTTAKLKKEAMVLDQQINYIGCYGVKDMIMLDRILNELDKRGVVGSYNLIFN